jgi:hypothetical protein
MPHFRISGTQHRGDYWAAKKAVVVPQPPGPSSKSALHLVHRVAPAVITEDVDDPAKARAIDDYNRRRGWQRKVQT